MNILFIYTSNKDRSPALEEYFEEVYPQHSCRSAGVNKYFTEKNDTHLITQADMNWADLVVFCEDIHRRIVHSTLISDYTKGKKFITLNLGEYKQGQIGEDYLLKAEEKLKPFL